jgi:hypothetical protein
MGFIIPIPLALLIVLVPFFLAWRLARHIWRLLVYLSRQILAAYRRGGEQ